MKMFSFPCFIRRVVGPAGYDEGQVQRQISSRENKARPVEPLLSISLALHFPWICFPSSFWNSHLMTYRSSFDKQSIVSHIEWELVHSLLSISSKRVQKFDDGLPFCHLVHLKELGHWEYMSLESGCQKKSSPGCS